MTMPPLRPIFIGGCERSGTTFLGALLGAAPGVVTVPESRFRFNAAIDAARNMPKQKSILESLVADSLFRHWNVPVDTALSIPFTYREAIEHLVVSFSTKVDFAAPSVWVDHTPINVRFAMVSHEHFPDAKHIHIVRDGRAVAASVLDLDWGPNSVVKAARHWMERVAHGLALETSPLAGQAMRVRYEDLLFDTEPTLRRVCDFCEIDFHSRMLEGGKFDVPLHTRAQHALVGQPPDPDRARHWERRLSAREVEIFESFAGDLLAYLGYETRYGLAAHPPTQWEHALLAGREWWCAQVGNKRRRRRRLALGVSEHPPEEARRPGRNLLRRPIDP